MPGQEFTQKIYQAMPSRLRSMADLLDIGVDLGASDVHLVSGCSPRYRMGPDLLKYEEAAKLKDGKTHEPMSLMEPETAKRLIYSMFTTKGQLDRFEREQEFDLSAETKRARFRVNVGVESRGVYSTIRVIPYRVRGIQELGDLGWLKHDIWEKIVSEDRGLVLITGETNSGKSTTLASLLQHILDTQHKKVMTVEDPIEYALRDRMGQAVQREVGVTTTSFYEAVKRFLRQNPDIIMVGETRDEETAKQAVRAAETGHLVFTTIHTNDASGSVGRTLDFLGNTEESRHRLADCLRYVASQKLIPREKRTGERTLAVEIMVVNGAIRSNIRTGKSENIRNVIQSGRSEGMMTMEQHLAYLVTRGLDREVAMHEANDKKEMESLLRQR